MLDVLKARRIKLTPHFAFARRSHIFGSFFFSAIVAQSALLRLKAVLWRSLCHGQQKCRLWPPEGRAHIDSEEARTRRGKLTSLQGSVKRERERVRHRPSLALSSGSSGVLGLSGQTLRGRLLRELSLKRGFECIAHLSARIKTSISATRKLDASDRS